MTAIRYWLMSVLLVWAGTGLAQTPAVTPAPTDPAAVAAASEPAAVPESGPEQPIPFSHKIHAGAGGLPCQTCHAASRSGESLTLPQASVCMQCHAAIATDKPAIRKLSGYAKDGRPIPWVRVYEVPSFVSFSHKVHLEHGNTCAACHGPVAERTTISKETDISMAGCMGCHKAKNAPSGCSTCHLLDQSRRGATGSLTGSWSSEQLQEGTHSPAGRPNDQVSLQRFLPILSDVGEDAMVRARWAEVRLPASGRGGLFSTLFE